MLHVFSINRVKLLTRKPTTTVNWGQREYRFSTFQPFIQSRWMLDLLYAAIDDDIKDSELIFSLGAPMSTFTLVLCSKL